MVAPSLYALPFCDIDLRTSNARPPLPEALAPVPSEFVLIASSSMSIYNLDLFQECVYGFDLITYVYSNGPHDLTTPEVE